MTLSRITIQKRNLVYLCLFVLIAFLAVAHGMWIQDQEKSRPLPAKETSWPSVTAGPSDGRFSYFWNTSEPDYKTIQETRWKQKPGCGCATDESELPVELRTLQVTPAAPVVMQNEPISLRYDASYLCNGQKARDLEGRELGELSQNAGVLKWNSMGVQNVPRLDGWVQFSGYHERGTYSVPFEIKVQCYDPGPECKKPAHFTVCSLKTQIPIKVVKRNKAKSK